MTVKQYKKTKSKSDFDRPVTMGVLLEFTDEFLIPRFSEVMEEMMDKKIKESEERTDKKLKIAISQLENSLKDYIDRKSTETIEEVFRLLDRRRGYIRNSFKIFSL